MNAVLGNLRKMKVDLMHPVQYQLPLSEQLINLNAFLGKQITLIYRGQINCIHCDRTVKKTFNQGYCYPCFISLAQCDLCIMKPETCHFEAGTCREPAWAEDFCFQPHYVYLANSSGVKVGITRETQIPIRWIDQGAVQALPIIKVQSRYVSGLIEVVIAKHVSDKTSWQRMLKNQVETVDLELKRDELLKECEAEITDIKTKASDGAVEILKETEVVNIYFPVEVYPTKVKSLNFDKTPEMSGILQGIKGQYLILDTGVINIRKFSGYEVELLV